MTLSVVAEVPVSNEMIVAPEENPASITYDEAGSGPVGASQVNVTVVPLTDADSPLEGVGAAAAATRPAVITVPLEHAPDEKAPVAPPEKQLHVTVAPVI